MVKSKNKVSCFLFRNQTMIVNDKKNIIVNK